MMQAVGLWITNPVPHLGLCRPIMMKKAACRASIWTPSFVSAPEPHAVPRPTGGRRVSDAWGILSPQAVSLAESRIHEAELATARECPRKSPWWWLCSDIPVCSFQVAVAVVPRAGRRYYPTIRSFARRLHDLWGVGCGKCNNGVMLFVSRDDHSVYLSVGHGALARIPRHVSNEIVASICPYLSVGKYDEGVLEGVNRITASLMNGANGSRYSYHHYNHSHFGFLFKLIIAAVIIAAIASAKAPTIQTWHYRSDPPCVGVELGLDSINACPWSCGRRCWRCYWGIPHTTNYWSSTYIPCNSTPCPPVVLHDEPCECSFTVPVVPPEEFGGGSSAGGAGTEGTFVDLTRPHSEDDEDDRKQ
ncbi:hypothetical protein Pelo_4722 [Pelomyxa schiedti]|nr:hypothetical protein Pelo_4722 [Pelomyxa schiedti]